MIIRKLPQISLVLLILLISCGKQKNAPLPQHVAPDWQRTEEIRQFTPENLWEYIDGGADRYVDAGLRMAWTAGYTDSAGRELTVDVFQMKSPGAARMLFEGEHPVDSLRVAVGENSIFVSGSLTFIRGPYFVRLTAFEEDPALDKKIIELGKALDRILVERLRK